MNVTQDNPWTMLWAVVEKLFSLYTKLHPQTLDQDRGLVAG